MNRQLLATLRLARPQSRHDHVASWRDTRPTGTCSARAKNKYTKPRQKKNQKAFGDGSMLCVLDALFGEVERWQAARRMLVGWMVPSPSGHFWWKCWRLAKFQWRLGQ